MPISFRKRTVWLVKSYQKLYCLLNRIEHGSSGCATAAVRDLLTPMPTSSMFCMSMENLLPIMQSILPQIVDNKWIDMLLNCSWKALEVIAAVKMLENQLRSQAPELVD